MPMLGITGKPNVGKSTFFSAATLATVPIANYPFTTKTPNHGIAYVKTPCACREFGVKDDPSNSLCLEGVRFVPIELIDCPGLVPGAYEGRGLGNQFLDAVRRADSLLLVVDASGATDIEGRPATPGSHDPLEDVGFIEREFDMWLLMILGKDWDKISRRVEATKENPAGLLLEKLAGLQIGLRHIHSSMSQAGLEKKKPTAWSREDLAAFSSTLRKISKPIIVVANKTDMAHAQENLERLKGAGHRVVACSAEAELVLRRASEKGLIEYKPGDPDFRVLKPEGLTPQQRGALEIIREKVLVKHSSTGVQEALDTAYFKLLDMISVFPVEDPETLSDHRGRVLPDCYLVPNGTTAKEFAGMIHSELREGFIYAIEARSKMRLGEAYVLKNRDVLKVVSAKARG